MNKIYLFGKVVYKSKLRYKVLPKLKLYIELEIITAEGSRFCCVVKERLLDSIYDLKRGDYVYINGVGTITNNLLQVLVKEIYKF